MSARASVALLVALVVGLVLGVGVLPTAWAVLRGVLGATSVWAELTLPATRKAFCGTLLVSGGAAAMALVVGAPLSLLLYRSDLPGRRLFVALFTLPFAVPPFIWGMGWVALANPKAGYLGRLVGPGVVNIYGYPGMAFVLGSAGLPLVLFAASAALSRIDNSLYEAARVSGASALRAAMQSLFPLTWPSLASGGLLVFLASASAFGVPYMLGVTASPPKGTLTTRIYAQVLMGGDDQLGRALVLSAVLLALATLVMLANGLVGRAGRVPLALGKGMRAQPLQLGRARTPLTLAVGLLAFVVVLAPLGAVLWTSVQRTYGAPLAFESLTLAHWGEILLSSRTLGAARNSIALATVAGVVICALGLVIALARKQYARAGRVVELLVLWPYAIPGTVLAMGLLIAYSQHWRFIVGGQLALVLALGSTTWMLLVAYAAKYLALGSRNVVESWTQLDNSLPESARVFGATPLRAFRDAVLPLLTPALATAFVLSFLLCATELTMSVLLVPAGTEVLGTLLFELQTYADPASASVLACAFVALVIGGLAALRPLQRRITGGVD